MEKSAVKRIVVKLGTGVLTSGVGCLELEKMRALCGQIAAAKKCGTQVVVVSSGAVGLGMGKLGLKTRPKDIRKVQMCSAVGQGVLIRTWEQLFESFGITVAQILLTRDDFDSFTRHRSIRELLDVLLKTGVVPIINENDCISAAETNIKFGDNDVLSALVATLSKADALMILSTASGLVDMRGTGEIVKNVARITPEIRSMAGGTSSATAVGGMITKIKAAEIATKSGCDVFIARGDAPDVITDILAGKNPGTKFAASKNAVSSRKRWLSYFGRTIAKIAVDSGAAKALRCSGGSLLPAGVRAVSGDFAKGEMVEIVDESNGEIVARGLAEVDAAALAQMRKHEGKCTHKYVVVHRDNMALV